MRDGAIAFDGAPRRFLEWAVREDAALGPPAARLFAGAGLSPLPVGVKEARWALRGAVDGTAAGWGRGLQAIEPVAETGARRPGRFSGHMVTKGVEAALEARDLWVELDPGDGPRDVLRGIDLEIERGERIALMGRNGAGKSTLLRTIARLTEPARGRAHAPADVALLAQSPSDYLVREKVLEELPGELGAAALEAVGLEWALDSDPRDLSGGERQRLALAIVMAGRGGASGPGDGVAGDDDSPTPGLVCLDEPTRGMDRARKDELAERLDALAREGCAVIVATHDVEFAATFCDRVVLLGEGEVIADGSRAEVLTGGWYFATEVARILPGAGAVTAEEGVAALAEAREIEAGA
jgi:energy-coupling factor transport system ATP-binding protein